MHLERSRAVYSQALQQTKALGTFVGSKSQWRICIQVLAGASAYTVGASVAVVMAAFACCFCGTNEQNCQDILTGSLSRIWLLLPVHQLWFRDFFSPANADTRLFRFTRQQGGNLLPRRHTLCTSPGSCRCTSPSVDITALAKRTTQPLVRFLLYNVAKWCVAVAGWCCHAVGSGRGQAAVQSGCW